MTTQTIVLCADTYREPEHGLCPMHGGTACLISYRALEPRTLRRKRARYVREALREIAKLSQNGEGTTASRYQALRAIHRIVTDVLLKEPANG
jgi:hypothetical protein